MSQELLIYYASHNGMLRQHHQITLESNAVLLTMLEHANNETHLVSVGTPRMMETTSLHGRSVQRAIAQLIQSKAIISLPKIKYGRSWVNAYRPTLLGMPKPAKDACADACALEGSDADAGQRNREKVFPQQRNAFDLLGADLQPKPKSKPKAESKPEIEKPTLEEKFGHVVELAMERSLKMIPPKKPAGEPLKIKKRKEMLRQIRLVEPTLYGIWLAKSIRSEALAELIQCQADGMDVKPETRAVVYPPSSIALQNPFKTID